MQLFLLINSRYRRVYGMQVLSDMLKVAKKWYIDLADLRQKHKLVIVMRDNVQLNAGENM